MADERWEKVVHAPGQGWLVDEFVERGEVPITAERVQSAACPRGRVLLIARSALEPLLDHEFTSDPTLCDPDLLAAYRHQKADRDVADLIREHLQQSLSNPRTLHKIVSVTAP